MKSFCEWRQDKQSHDNPDMLIEKLGELAHQFEEELDAFAGERFPGFLDLIGNVRSLQHKLAEVQHGVVDDAPKSLTGL